MPTFYFDTSALFKRYQDEVGTPVIDHIFKLFEEPEYKASISFLTLLEVIASARRLLKGKVIDEGDFDELIRGFLDDVENYFVPRGMDAKLFFTAIELALKHALRTADSLQLATVLDLKRLLDRAGEQLIFVVDDDDLYEAAKQEKLQAINPREKDALKRLRQLTKSG